MIYVTGDTHFEFRRLGSKVWPEGQGLSKSDYLIVAGDFGLLWSNKRTDEETYWLNWLNEKPWTTLFVDGNHENFYRLGQLKTVEMFDGQVGKVSDSVYHLRRGYVYSIPDIPKVTRKVFTFGGAVSIDKQSRQEHISWWPEELASHREMTFGLESLERHGREVDLIVTHTIPSGLYLSLGIQGPRFNIVDPTEDYLSEVRKTTRFKRWYFGHWHVNQRIDYDGQSFQALYEDVLKADL